MKIRRKLLALLMTLAMVLSYMPALAFADTVNDEDPVEVMEDVDAAESVDAVEVEAVSGDSSVDIGETDDELLEMFLENHVKQEVSSAPKKDRNLLKAHPRSSKLDGVNLTVYNGLAEQIRQIAAGNRSNTEILVDISSMFDERITYTAEDLGVDSLYDGDEVSKIAGNAATEAFYKKIGFTPATVMDALLADMPYEMYWYDKTPSGGYSYWPEGMLVWGETDESEACIGFDPNNQDSIPEIGFELKVSADYSKTGAVDTIYVDTSKTGAAAEFVETTANIINDNKSKSDFNKLTAYKDEICGRAAYNDTAAAGGIPYGDPWQMIWVFDGNENTKVVCEGYAKAFQFLCDQSEFESDAVECYTVTGPMGYMDGDTLHSEDHMWNILHMDDDKYYTSDITNCDENTAGAPDKLFLKGAVENGVPDDFDIGYDCDDEKDGTADIWYQYDQNTRKLYGEQELLVSDTDYEEGGQGDDAWYEFEFAGNEGESDILYSDGIVKYRLEEAVIPDGASLDLRVGINTGNFDEGEHGWLTQYDFTEGQEYTFDTETKTLTLYGDKAYKKIGDNFNRISFFAGIVETDDYAGWIGNGGCEFRVARAEYPFPDDRDMLVDWDGWINAEDNAWVENAQHPDGEDVPYQVTGVTSSDPSVVSIEAGDDNDGWNYIAKAIGEATVTITYRDVLGEDKYGAEQTYSFQINVSENVYVADLWINNDSDKFLPGDSVELETRIIHYNHDLEGGESDITNDVDLTWSLPDDGTDYAAIAPKEGEGNKAVVTFKSKEVLESAGLLDEGGNLWRDISARVVASKNGENFASRDQRLTVSTDYMEIAMTGEGASFGRLCDLEVGESMTFGLDLRHYTSDCNNDKGYDLVNDVQFSWDYNDDCATITGPDQQDKYTVTRLDSFDGWMKVTASRTDDSDREESRDMNFNEKDYNFWFDEHDIDVFSDEESAVAVLNISNFGEDFDDRFDLRIDAGRWDDRADNWVEGSMLNKGSDYTVSSASEGKVTVTLSESFISSVEDYDDIRLEPHIFIKGTDKEVRGGEDCWFHLRTPRTEYDYETEREILPGGEGSIDGHFRVHIENSEFPDGKDSDYSVTDVEVVEGEDLLEDFHKDTGDDPYDYWWYFRAKDFDKNPVGNVKFKVTYTDPEGDEGNKGTYEFVLHIQNDIYEVYVDSEDGRYKAFPEGEIGLTAWAAHKFLDENGEYQETYDDFALEWDITGGENFATVTPVAGDPAKATVSFEPMPEGWDSIREEVEAMVTLKKDGTEKASDRIRLWCESDYLELVPVRLNSRLHVGTSTGPVTFELRRYDMSNDGAEDGYTVVPVNKYEFYFDGKAFDIADSEGNEVKDQGSAGDDEDFSSTDHIFTITRKGDWGSEVHVNALWQEDGQWEDYECSYHFDDLNYDLWFDEHEKNVFTDADSITADLDVSSFADGWENSPVLNLTVGVWDDDKDAWVEGGILTRGKEYTVSNVKDGRITISLKKSYYETLTKYTNIHMVAKLMSGTGDGASEIRDADAWFHIQVPETDWDREYDMSLLPGWEAYVDSEYELIYFNSAHPDGDFTSYKVNDVVVASQEPAEEGTEVIKIDKADDGWKITALNPGKATVTVTHTRFNNGGKEQASYQFDVYVGNDVYNVDIVNGSNNWDGLPGDKFELEADAVHFYLDESGNQQATREGLTYQWILRSDANGLADLTVDSTDPSKATLKFKSLDALPDELKNQDWFERQINVTVKVTDSGNDDPNEVVTESSTDFRMTKVYEEIRPIDLSETIRNLKPGESTDIVFSTVTREAGEEAVKRDDVRYRIFFDQSNPLTVKDAEGKPVGHGDRITGNKITITRDNALSTALGVRAEADNNSGDPNDFRILGFRNYQFNLDEKTESTRISGLADAAETAADDAAEKAELAAGAVDALKDAAEAAKTAADKAAQSLDAADIADAQAKTAAAEEAQTAAAAAIEAAEAAKTAADEAVETAKAAIAGAEKQHVPIDETARTKVNDASTSAGDTAAGITSAQAEKASQDAVVSKASATASKAASDKAAADKAAADAAKAKAAAEKAEADRKAAEYAANGNAYIDPTLPKVKIKGPKKAKKSFTAQWKKLNKKQQKKVKGIEIEYSLTRDFQNPLFKTAGKKKANVKVRKLKSKKTYYVRAHTYVIRNGQKYVSNWSAAKKVKVK